MEFLFLATLVGGYLSYSTAKAYQLHKFNAYMQVVLYEHYRTDKWKQSYIDINQSYENVMCSAAWKHNFKDMIKYEAKL
jgi:hypothetical protein